VGERRGRRGRDPPVVTESTGDASESFHWELEGSRSLLKTCPGPYKNCLLGSKELELIYDFCLYSSQINSMWTFFKRQVSGEQAPTSSTRKSLHPNTHKPSTTSPECCAFPTFTRHLKTLWSEFELATRAVALHLPPALEFGTLERA
jgi:hypothetical protein